jgi:hypothetical protein
VDAGFELVEGNSEHETLVTALATAEASSKDEWRCIMPRTRLSMLTERCNGDKKKNRGEEGVEVMGEIRSRDCLQ